MLLNTMHTKHNRKHVTIRTPIRNVMRFMNPIASWNSLLQGRRTMTGFIRNLTKDSMLQAEVRNSYFGGERNRYNDFIRNLARGPA